MKHLIHNVSSWLWEQKWVLLFLFFIVKYYKRFIQYFVLDPLQGKDNKTSMEEFAKFIIVCLLIYITYKDGTRDNEWRYFSDETYLYLLLGVSAIAGLPIFNHFINKKYGTEKDE